MYLECVTCPKLGVSCDGPNFLAMSAHELWEWCKARKAHLRITNAQLAELSGTPKGTIDRLFAKDQVDFKFETIRPMIKVLVGGSFDGNPCPDPHDQQMDEYIEEKIKRLEDENARMKEFVVQAEKQHHTAITEAREEDLKRITFLREQVTSKDRLLQERHDYMKLKDKYIRILASLLAVALLVIIGALVVDKMNPDVGFFWRTMAEHFSGSETNTDNNMLLKIFEWSA